MLFFIITTILLLSVSIYLGYRVWFLAGIVGDIQEQTDDYVRSLELTNEFMYGKIVDAYETMKKLDHLGAFESEDEAGTTFALLNEVIINLKEQFDGQEEKK